MTVPNFITLVRFLLVPVMAWAILAGHQAFGFAVFLLAGLSDAADGVLARLLDQRSALGAVLDPLADKAMLVTAFLLIGILGWLEPWVVAIVLSRDVLLLLGIGAALFLKRDVRIAPLMVSKATTLFQILLVALILGTQALHFAAPMAVDGLKWLVVGFTLLSGAAYAIAGARILFWHDVENLPDAREAGREPRIAVK